MPELIKTILANSANLKAYYRFESGALTTDSSGNSHTLTAVGDPAETTGVYGGAVALDSNDCYTIVDHADLKPTGAFSIGTWINLTASASNQTIFQTYSQNSNVAGVQFFTSSNKVVVVIGKNTGTTLNTDYKLHTGTATLSDATTYHVVCTWDTATIRVYINGAFDSSVACTIPPAYAATNYVRVGAVNTSGTDTNFLDGWMDDLFLLNGTALSADQIKELYEGRFLGELRPNQYGTTAGLWHLNGNSTDSSGNNNHGTDTAITYSLANGKLGQGADFNGSNGRVQCADSASLSITGNYSLCCWINIDALPGTNAFMNILGKYDVLSGGTVNTGYEMRLHNDGGTQKIGIIHGSSGTSTLTVTRTLDTGVWLHLCGVYNGSTIKLYLNGNEIGTVNETNNPADNSKALNFGNFGYYTPTSGELGRYFNGKIDEVYIASTALTANQIRQMYSIGVGKYF